MQIRIKLQERSRAFDLIRHVFVNTTGLGQVRVRTRSSTRVEHLPSISKQKCEFSSSPTLACASRVGNINSCRFEGISV